MKRDISYGVIPLIALKNDWSVFLVEHKNGAFWAFPKGHSEEGESNEEAAMRELEEETALKVKQFYKIDPIEEHYTYKHQDGHYVDKTVVYYFAEVETSKFVLDQKEILNGRWLSFDEAAKLITFDECRRVCVEAKRRFYAYTNSQ